MRHEIVIRGGLVVDGSGAAARRADIAIDGGRITAVGTVEGRGEEEVDAQGLVVTPGFIDIHTHYDGQAIWSDRLSPSSCHGVTTVVLGNCGVGFAPCRPADRERLIRMMEGVEDIPGAVMADGLSWSWESFPEYLDALDARPRDIDVAAYLPHSPLRVYAMGERGLAREEATDADLARMRALAREAAQAGALGFATSSLVIHRTADNEQIPSYQVHGRELREIALGLAEGGGAVIQAVPDYPDIRSPRPVLAPLLDAARASGLSLTFSFGIGNNGDPHWRTTLEQIVAANAQGTAVYPQVFPRPVGLIIGLDVSAHPFTDCPGYRAIAHLPLAERVARLRDPAFQQRLLTEQPDSGHPITQMARTWDWMFPLAQQPDYEPDRQASIAARAAARGVSPEREAMDELLKEDGHAKMFVSLGNFPHNSLDEVLELLNHPNTVLGQGDGGAHYGMVCDASYPTFLLAHWVRDRDGERLTLEKAVNALTAVPARTVGFADRGLIAPGYKADLNIIDLAALTLHRPHVVDDLPAGGRRLDQRATGYVRTIVSGETIQQDGVPTPARPGRLVRNRGMAAAAP